MRAFFSAAITAALREEASSSAAASLTRSISAGTVALLTPSCAVNQKVLPWPGRLCTPTSPPISCANCLQMARPRPVPPYSRVVEVSACWKDWNRRSISGSLRPMPLSLTSKRSTQCWASPTTCRTRTSMRPFSLNLMALLA